MDTIFSATVIILTVIGFLMVILLIGGIVYLKSKGKIFKHLYHDKLDWHISTYVIDEDCSMSYCAVCGQRIYRVKDGPWVTSLKF